MFTIFIASLRYYCSLDNSGQRIDRKSRPELQLCSVEFNVGKEYCVRPMQVGGAMCVQFRRHFMQFCIGAYTMFYSLSCT